ncbi:MAG: carbohydrate binding domain-containing protein [Tepidisphaeraceae bacterium]
MLRKILRWGFAFSRHQHRAAADLAIRRAAVEALESRRLLALVPLVNPSFEDATLGDGQAQAGAPDGWAFESDGFVATVDTYNPTAADLGGNQVPDGQNVIRLHLGWNDAGEPVALTQITDDAVFTAGTAYTLNLNTVLYSPQQATSFPLIVWVELLAGDQVVGQKYLNTDPMAAGSPASQVTVSSTAPANHAMLGQPLSIRIGGTAQEEGPSGYIGFDNFTLDATPLAPAMPTNFLVRGSSPTTMWVEWSDQSSNEAGFEIQRKDSSGAWQTIHTNGPNVAYWSDSGLEPSTFYTYRIRATGSGSQPHSAWTSEAVAPTRGPLPEIDNFEPASVANWLPFASDHSSSSASLRTPGHVGQGAMQIDYSLADNEYNWGGAGLYNYWNTSQDWSGHGSLELDFEGQGSGREMHINIRDNRGGASNESEVFDYEFLDDTTGWRHLSIPFTSFVRKSVQLAPDAPNDGFGRDEVWGIGFYTMTTDFEYGEGSFALDEIFLTNNTAPPDFDLSATAISPSQIELQWEPLEGATRYELEISDGVEFFQTTRLNGSAGNATIDGLLPSSFFEYRLSAFNGAQMLGGSNTAGATTQPAAPPTAPPTSGPATQSATQGPHLVAFFGAGPIGDNAFGNLWFREIVKQAGGTIKADGAPYPENDYNEALFALLGRIDTDGNKTIEQGEVYNGPTPIDVKIVGYSFGAISAINLSRRLTDDVISWQDYPTYTLDVDIPVESLVAIDPVNSTFFGLSWLIKHVNGPVKSNVAKYRGYWRTRTGQQIMDLSIAGIGIGPEDMGSPAGSIITGDFIKSKSPDTVITNVDTQRTNTIAIHFQYPTTDPRHQGQAGEMTGSRVGHDTMPWYLFEEVRNELLEI